MRQISALNILIDINNAVAIFSVASLSIYSWLTGTISVGAIAVAIGLAMRINGMSQWIMWEVTALFESIGTVYDGMGMMTKAHDIVDTPQAARLAAPKVASAMTTSPSITARRAAVSSRA